jgi:hypothetical protein
VTATQQDAVRVLAKLTAIDDLPRLSWDVRPYDGAPLTAQPWADDADAKVADLAAWADHLGAEVVTTRYDKYTQVQVSAEIDGVTVEIFTHTDQTHTWVPIPIEQAGGAK